MDIEVERMRARLRLLNAKGLSWSSLANTFEICDSTLKKFANGEVMASEYVMNAAVNRIGRLERSFESVGVSAFTCPKCGSPKAFVERPIMSYKPGGKVVHKRRVSCRGKCLDDFNNSLPKKGPSSQRKTEFLFWQPLEGDELKQAVESAPSPVITAELKKPARKETISMPKPKGVKRPEILREIKIHVAKVGTITALAKLIGHSPAHLGRIIKVGSANPETWEKLKAKLEGIESGALAKPATQKAALSKPAHPTKPKERRETVTAVISDHAMERAERAFSLSKTTDRLMDIPRTEDPAQLRQFEMEALELRMASELVIQMCGRRRVEIGAAGA